MSSGFRNLLAVAAAALAACVQAGAAEAQSYPSKPIRILVGFATGGSTDIVARVIASELATDLKQPVVVENKPGAGGRIAAEQTAKAAPDGYTLYAGTAGTVVQIATGEKMPFDLFRDLTPVALLAQNPHVLVVHPSVPAKSVRELAVLAREKGNLAYASAGPYTSLHIAGALFGVVAGAKLLHVPYKSGGPALTDLLAGRVPMMFADVPTVITQIKSGALRALAVTGAARTPLLPEEVPTMAEAGYGAVDTNSWFGLMATAGTPKEAVDLLNARINAALRKDTVRAKLAELGLTPTGGSAADYTAFLNRNMEFWKRAVEQTGAKME